jgi:hypothetical protein
MVAICFKTNKEPVELNCPVHSDALELLTHQHECAVGFIVDGDLKSSFFVPLRLISESKNLRRASA